MNGQTFTRFLSSTWGAMAVIAAAAAIGWASSLWFASLPASEAIAGLEERIGAVEQADRVLADSVSATSDRLVWVICTSVPPNRADVLAALRVSCDYDSAGRNTIRGIPLLEDEDD